jgi:TolA-binding protein
MTPKLKKISITLLALGALFILYAILKPSPDKVSLTDGLSAPKGSLSSAEAQELGNQITQALIQIKQISLDTSIFDDEIYKSLKDRSQQISEEPIGRPNPFAPLGDISTSNVISATLADQSKISATATSSKNSATSTSSKTATSTINR